MKPIRIRQFVKPECRLALEINKRSLQSRKSKANELSSTLQKKLQNIPSGNFSVKALKELFISINADMLMDIVPLEQENAEGILSVDIEMKESEDENYDAELFHTKYRMALDIEDEMINSSNGVIVHEARHMFDKMCLPKYIPLRNLEQRFDENNIKDFYKIHDVILEPNVYKPKRIFGIIKIPSFEKELTSICSEMDKVTLINILQQYRYVLQSERNAYSDYIKFYARKIPQDLTMLYKIPQYLLGHLKEFNYVEKNRVLNKYIKKLINEERFNTK